MVLALALAGADWGRLGLRGLWALLSAGGPNSGRRGCIAPRKRYHHHFCSLSPSLSPKLQHHPPRHRTDYRLAKSPTGQTRRSIGLLISALTRHSLESRRPLRPRRKIPQSPGFDERLLLPIPLRPWPPPPNVLLAHDGDTAHSVCRDDSGHEKGI